jgi:hypothetical protein
MTRFEWFESGAALIAAKLSVIPIDLLFKYDCYKSYRDFKDRGFTDADSRVLASESRGVHSSCVVRAVYWFERDDPNNNSEEAQALRKRIRKACFPMPEKQQA